MILHPTDDPCSYLVDTSSGIVRRNRHHLIPLPQTTPSTSESESPPLPESCIETPKDPSPSRSPIVTRSRSQALRKGPLSNNNTCNVTVITMPGPLLS